MGDSLGEAVRGEAGGLDRFLRSLAAPPRAAAAEATAWSDDDEAELSWLADL